MVNSSEIDIVQYIPHQSWGFLWHSLINYMMAIVDVNGLRWAQLRSRGKIYWKLVGKIQFKHFKFHFLMPCIAIVPHNKYICIYIYHDRYIFKYTYVPSQLRAMDLHKVRCVWANYSGYKVWCSFTFSIVMAMVVQSIDRWVVTRVALLVGWLNGLGLVSPSRDGRCHRQTAMIMVNDAIGWPIDPLNS